MSPSRIFILRPVATSLLMIGLLRFFYGWIFHPIRDLEQGVNRVARGDFEHRIELDSGDEMEELAAAFAECAPGLGVFLSILP